MPQIPRATSQIVKITMSAAGKGLSGESAEEGLHFVGNLRGVGEGLADFVTEQLTITAAEAMDGAFPAEPRQDTGLRGLQGCFR